MVGVGVDVGLRQGLENLVSVAREALDVLAAGEDLIEGGGSPDWLGVVRRVEVAERVAHGVKLQLLAEADRGRSARAGIGAWLKAELGYSGGRARGLAEEARRLGAVPELAGKLSGGELNQDQTRVVARVVKAARGAGVDPSTAVAETLTVLERDGVAKARAGVRVLEETLAPGSVKDLAAGQRARSFLRVSETGEGMVRIDALLDAGRGTVVRAALDQVTAGWIRSGQYDEVAVLPQDVVSVEQIGAQALTRLAELYFTVPEDRRVRGYRPQTLYVTHATGQGSGLVQDSAAAAPVSGPGVVGIPAGCARTVYGELVPAEGLPAMRDGAAELLTLDPGTGLPLLIDGRGLDVDPGARLASRDQRVALGFRDGHCTEPGCTRPVTWSLHAHHVTAHANGGATVMRNLVLLCSEHHVLRHHPDHRLAA